MICLDDSERLEVNVVPCRVNTKIESLRPLQLYLSPRNHRLWRCSIGFQVRIFYLVKEGRDHTSCSNRAQTSQTHSPECPDHRVSFIPSLFVLSLEISVFETERLI